MKLISSAKEDLVLHFALDLLCTSNNCLAKFVYKLILFRPEVG